MILVWHALLVIFLSASASFAQFAETATGGTLRVLDKTNGTVSDFDFASGESAQKGLISVQLRECRYPTSNPTGDAFALITVRAQGVSDPVFDGWMVASAPALNALEHPRYDVWVLRCKMS
jgi:hypothetical protein